MNDEFMTQSPSSTNQAGAKISSVASDLRTAATEKLGQTASALQARADDAKTGVADEVKDVASALRRASEEMRGGSAQERTLGSIAGSLADASDQIRDKDLGEIARMVTKVARDNPVLFLSGAALLGFAASRFAKASGENLGASARVTPAEQKEDVSAFVNEGNPNAQPVGAF